MDPANIKLKILRRIVEADETSLQEKVQEAFTEFCTDCNTSLQVQSQAENYIIAYKKDGRALTASDLKQELLVITDEANKGLPVHHRLNDILWL